MIRPALRTEVLLPEAPHRFGRRAPTTPDAVPGLLATEHVPATAHAGIDRLADPGELARILSTLEEVRCITVPL
jgi:hypothetical protein